MRWSSKLRERASWYFRGLAVGSIVGRNTELQAQAYVLAWQALEREYERMQRGER